MVGAARRDALGELEHPALVHASLERAKASATLMSDRRDDPVLLRAGDDALPGLERLLDGRVLVSSVERLRRAERELDPFAGSDAASRSYPRSFSASPARTTPSTRSTPATTSSAPAICGRGAGRRSSRPRLRGARRNEAADELGPTSGASTSGSFWRPSRGPTSKTSRARTSPRGHLYRRVRQRPTCRAIVLAWPRRLPWRRHCDASVVVRSIDTDATRVRGSCPQNAGGSCPHDAVDL